MVAFQRKVMCFQIGVQRSKSLRLPGLGALGCMSTEGRSLVVARQANMVTAMIIASEPNTTASAIYHANPR